VERTVEEGRGVSGAPLEVVASNRVLLGELGAGGERVLVVKDHLFTCVRARYRFSRRERTEKTRSFLARRVQKDTRVRRWRFFFFV
jgi:hypothetical protein